MPWRRGTGRKAGADAKACLYQYCDGDSHVFLLPETMEQLCLPRTVLEGREAYLREGDVYTVIMRGNRPVDVRIRSEMVFTVVESDGSAGLMNSRAGTKSVRTDTGLVVRVPHSIEVGERILVNTVTNEYVERVND